MIFITKKAFEEEIFRRVQQINFRDETERKLYNHGQEIADLKWRVEMLEKGEQLPECTPTDLGVASISSKT